MTGVNSQPPTPNSQRVLKRAGEGRLANRAGYVRGARLAVARPLQLIAGRHFT
jgi:hypothetical protein